MKIIRFILIIFLNFGIIGCSHKLQFDTSVPTSNQFQSIKTLAIGDIQIVRNNELILRDNNGAWIERNRRLNTQGIKTLLRHSLISSLNRFSNFEIIDLDKFNIIYGDQLNFIKPESGLSVKKVDAVLNLKLAIEVITQNGSYQEVKSFQDREIRKVGKKWKTTKNSSKQRVVTLPYQTKNMTATLTAELIKVRNGNIELLGVFSDVFVLSLGNALSPASFAQDPDGGFLSIFSGDKRSKDQKIRDLPFYKLSHETRKSPPSHATNLTNRIAVLISNFILPKFSRYTVLTTRTIDADGDKQAVTFLKQARIEAAKTRIESILSTPGEKTANNLYNLAICYEALGEHQIATKLYEEALMLDEGNSTYIEALAALESNPL